MARQLDPWLGAPQAAVLEENLLAVQVRMQGMEARLRGMEARLGRVAAALLILADQVAAGDAPGGTEDVPAAVSRKVTELLEEIPC